MRSSDTVDNWDEYDTVFIGHLDLSAYGEKKDIPLLIGSNFTEWTQSLLTALSVSPC